MSLNKLTTSTDYLQKQFLNIGCNDIKCTTLEVGGSGAAKGACRSTLIMMFNVELNEARLSAHFRLCVAFAEASNTRCGNGWGNE